MTTATPFTIRPMDDADEPHVLDLLRASLGGGPAGERTSSFFRWKHRDSPFGRSYAYVADHDGDIIGLRAFMRWRFVAGGHPVPAVRAVDTATHADHRGGGVFSQLTRAAMDAIRQDIDLIFNTPNASSLPGYLKMGWQEVGKVPLRLRPVRPMRVARSLRQASGALPDGREPPACQLPLVRDVLTDEIGALLEASADDGSRLTTDRSIEYLRWRYADAPGLGYRALALRAGTSVRALAIGRPRWRGPLAEFTLSEVLVVAGDRPSRRELLQRVATESGCDHVTAAAGPDARSREDHLRAGYLPLPGQGLLLVANPLHDIRPDPRSLASWSFSLGDLEVF